MDAESFAALMERVYRRTRGLPRGYLQPKAHRHVEHDECTFSPQISRESARLASKKRDKAGNVYEQLHSHAAAARWVAVCSLCNEVNE